MDGDKMLLWIGGAITAAAAIFFPRIEGIRADDESWWRLLTFFVPQDAEGVILIPLVIVLTVALYALLGRWSWNDPEAQTARRKSDSLAACSASSGCSRSSLR
jgi:hypothetical protein